MITPDFTALGAHPALATALAARGYAEPTPVQAAVLDAGLAGKDLLVSSRTGSGKILKRELRAEAVQALVPSQLPAVPVVRHGRIERSFRYALPKEGPPLLFQRGFWLDGEAFDFEARRWKSLD